jgi:hypothetical protein
MKSNRLVLLFAIMILIFLACRGFIPETPTEEPTPTEAPNDEPPIEEPPVTTNEPPVATDEPPVATEPPASSGTEEPVTEVPATELPVTEASRTEVPAAATALPQPPSLDEQLAKIDEILKQSVAASIAYNAPSEMHLNETVTVQLLLNPSLTEQELKKQVSEPGPIHSSGNVSVTPRTRAELITQDPDAFTINQIPENPEQLINPNGTTEWKWLLTARKEGQQTLTLVIYRLVQYEGRDYWLNVQSYKADINVNVTLGQRVQFIDWKWWVGVLVTAILIPAFWRWVDHRKRDEAASKQETSKPSGRKENTKHRKK